MGLYVNVDVVVTMVGHIELFHVFVFNCLTLTCKIMEEFKMGITMNIKKTIMVVTGLLLEELVRFLPNHGKFQTKTMHIILRRESLKGVRFPLFHQ